MKLLSKSPFIFLLLSLIIGIFLSGCSSRETARKEKKTPIQDFSRDFGQNTLENSVYAQKKETLLKTPEAEFQEVVLPYADRILKRSYLDNHYLMGSSEFIKELERFNNALLNTYPQKELASKHAEVLARYQTILEDSCDPGTWKNCQYLPLFKQDSGTRTIIKFIALQNESNVRLYYRYLTLALDFSNRRRDKELEKLWLKSTMRFFNSYIKEKKNVLTIAHLSKDELREFKHYSKVISTIMLLNSEENNFPLDKDELKKLFFWYETGALRKILSESTMQNFSQLLIKKVKDSTFVPIIEQIVLRQDELDQLEGAENGINMQLNSSYFSALRNIELHNPEILKIFSLKPFSVEDLKSDPNKMLNYYIIKRLFKIERERETESFWEASAKNEIQFLEMMKNYIQVQLISTSITTNRKMSELIRNETVSRRGHSKILENYMKKVEAEVTPMWSDFWRRVNMLEDFFENKIVFNKLIHGNQDKLVEIKKMKNFFKELGRNVKFMVAYPNILIFTYYAKKMRFNKEFYFGLNEREKFDLNSRYIITSFMKARVPELFEFSEKRNDVKNAYLNRLEINYAIYFTIQGNLLELYGIDPVDWFHTITDVYLKKNTDDLKRELTRISNFLDKNKYFKEFKNVCSKIKNYSASGKNSLENIIELKHLHRRLFFGKDIFARFGAEDFISNVLENSIVMRGAQNRMMAETLEIIRSDVDPKLKNIILLRNIVSGSNKNGHYSSLIEEMDAYISEVNSFRESVFLKINDGMNTIVPCIFTFYEEELKRQREVFHMELQHSKHIYLALSALNELEHEKTTVKDLRASTSHPIWEESFFTELSPDESLFHAIKELFYEKAGYNSIFEKLEEFKRDYEVLSGFQKDNRGGYYFRFRRQDLLIRIASYLQNGYNGMTVSNQIDKVRIEFPQNFQSMNSIKRDRSEVDFYYYEATHLPAFQSFFMQEVDKHISWFEDKNSITFVFRQLLQNRVALFKLRYELDLDMMKKFHCQEACLKERHRAMKKEFHEIIGLSRQILMHTQINGLVEDQSILNLLNTPSFYGLQRNGPQYLFVRGNVQKSYVSLLDEVYSYLISFHLGKHSKYRGYRIAAEKSSSDDKRLRNGEIASLMSQENRDDFFAEAEKIFSSLKNQNNHILFQIPKETLDEINENMTSRIKTEIRMVVALEEAIEEYEKTYGVPTMQFNLHREPFTGQYLLSPYLRSNYHEDIKHFNKQSDGLFLPEELHGNPVWDDRIKEN